MSVAQKQRVVPTFARHETFTLRYAWLKRAYDAIVEPNHIIVANSSSPPRPKATRSDYYLFNDADAHHMLGVGKNMARSIRFWVQACRIVEELKVEGARSHVGLPTAFGQALLDSLDGLDPYTEQQATWWLLHWMMLSPGSHLPVWWVAFHTFGGVTFTTQQLLDHVEAQIDATSGWQKPKLANVSTIKKDVLALLRCYAGTSGSRRRDTVDDELDAPFAPLTLVRTSDEPGVFRFGVGPKPGLPPAVAAFACLDFLSRTGNAVRQILVATLAGEQGGPGRAFKLHERDLTELLEKAAADASDLIQIVSTAGSDALAVVADLPLGTVAAKLLHRHYAACRSAAPEPEGPYLPWNVDAGIDDGLRLVRPRRESWT